MTEQLIDRPPLQPELLSPDFTSQGFNLQLLTHEGLPQPVPIESAFVLNAEDRGRCLDDSLANGSIALLEGDQQIPSGHKVIRLAVDTLVFENSSELQSTPFLNGLKAGDSLKLTPNTETTEKIRGIFGGSIDYSTKRAVLGAVTEELDDYSEVLALDSFATITQAFEVASGSRSVSLYNFDELPIPTRALQEMMNVLRATSDATGGSVLDSLKAIAVLPDSHSGFHLPEYGSKVAKGYANGKGYIAINADIFGMEPDSPDSYSLFTHPVENVLSHELGHIMHFQDMKATGKDQVSEELGWKDGQQDQDDGFALPYGRTNQLEHVAEISSALHEGNERLVRDKERIAVEGLRKRIHSNEEGPTYLRVTEIDLAHMSDRIGSKPKEPLAIVLDESLTVAKEPML